MRAVVARPGPARQDAGVQTGAQRPTPQTAVFWRGWWRRYRLLSGCALLAAAVLGYWAVGEQPPESARRAARQLIPDSSLPDPSRRALDEVTIEQTVSGAAPAKFALQRRRAGGQSSFYLTPPGSRADDAVVETLFSALLSAVIERRLSPAAPADAARQQQTGRVAPAGPPGDSYGVGAGQCRVQVRFGAGHWLCFGGESASGSVYVRADSSPEVLVVDRGLFELLARPPARYRASRLIQGSLQGAHQLTLGTLRLTHDGDLWRVAAPGQPATLAEPAQVTALLQWLAAWSVVAWPADPAATGAPAGFLPPREPPPLHLSVDGEELLRGGWPPPPACPPATRLFVRGSREAVCADEPEARRLDPRALRAERLVPLTSAEVAQLQLAGSLQLQREPDGTYTRAGQPVETASVRRLLAQLLAASAAPAPPARLTAPPAEAVRLTLRTTLGQQLQLQLWRRGAVTWAQRDDEPPQQLAEPLAELFSLGEQSFAPLQLVTVEPAAVYRIERSRPGSVPPSPPEVLERLGRWQLRAPTAAPLASAAVAALLDSLVDLRAERWVGPQAQPAFGLDPPQLRLALRWGKKESPESQPAAPRPAAARELTLDLGAAASERGDCYARRAGSPQVAVLPATACAALAQPLLSPLLLRVDDDRLVLVQLTLAQEAAAELRCTQGDGRWRCDGTELPAAARRTLLQALHGLQSSKSPAYAALPAGPPQLTLRVVHAPLTATAALPGEEVAPPEQLLRIYPAASSGWLAWADQRPVHYPISPAAVAAVRELATALRPAAPR